MSRGEIFVGMAAVIAALGGPMSPIAVADTPAALTSNKAFAISSGAFADGGLMSLKYTGSLHDCRGVDISPPLAWRNAPAGTRSFAVTLFDVDGRIGLGVVHWVVYGIPSDVMTLKEGAGAAPGAGFVAGMNTRNSPRYAGPCPPPGASLHHYIFTVYALDLGPGSLRQGLSRDGLLSAMNGHILGESSIVARFARK